MKTKLSSKVPKINKLPDETLAVISKLNRNSEPKDIIKNIGNLRLPEISSFTKHKIENNESLLQLFPDIELSIEILVSSILAPNDLAHSALTYKLNSLHIPSEIRSTIIDTIKEYMDKEYKITKKLPTMIKESLFTKGAYAEVVIPEAALDEIINKDIYAVSTETLKLSSNIKNMSMKLNKSLGIFEPEINASVGLESLTFNSKPKDLPNVIFTDDDLGLEFSDTPSLLNLKKIQTETASKYIKTRLSEIAGVEDKKVNNDIDSLLDDIFIKNYKNNNMDPNKKEELINIKTSKETKRQSVGKPLVMKIPVESIVPIHITGAPEEHLGYFILLDENGVPIKDNKDWKMNNTQDLNELIRSELIAKKSMLEKAKKALRGITTKAPTINDLEELYSSILEKRIKDRIKASIYGEIAEFDDIENIYRIMLSRTLKARKTKLLFVPKELMTYITFRHRENGTGESLLEIISVLGSIRAILLFTRILANMKNSITTTEVSAELDEHDPDPKKTMELIISEVMKTRQTQLPIGVTRVDDLTEWAHKVGFKFNFKHPELPDMQIETNESNTSKVVPDSDLEEEIRKFIIMSFGLSPEIVENGFSPDFATTAVMNNLLFTKRVIKHQDIFVPQLSDHVKRIITNDYNIKDKILDIIESNYTAIMKTFDKDVKAKLKGIKKEEVIKWIADKVIEDIETSLPRPEAFDADGNAKAFKEYVDQVDEALEYIFSADALPDELAGEMSDKLDDIKSSMKALMVRKWMSENNYLPELLKVITLDENGKPYTGFLDEYRGFVKVMGDAILPFLKEIKKTTSKIDKKLEKIEEEPEEENENNEEGNEPTENTGEENGENNEGEETTEESTGDEEDLGEEETESEGDKEESDSEGNNEDEFNF